MLKEKERYVKRENKVGARVQCKPMTHNLVPMSLCFSLREEKESPLNLKNKTSLDTFLLKNTNIK